MIGGISIGTAIASNIIIIHLKQSVFLEHFFTNWSGLQNKNKEDSGNGHGKPRMS